MADFVISENNLYHLAKDAGLLDLIKTVQTPTFDVDKKMGEGTATKEELKYRQQLQNLIKKVWNAREESDTEIHDLIDELFISDDSDAKQLAEDFINTVYTTNAENMVKKLKKLGIKTQVLKSSEQKDKLIKWQKFAVEKIGRELELGIMNQRLSKDYFEASYGNKSKSSSG